MKLNDIRNEDCLDTMQIMSDTFVDLVVTSPPYDEMREYEGYTLESFEQIASELYRVVKVGGVVVWVIGDQTTKGNETGTSFRQALYFKLKFGQYCKLMLPYQKAGVYRLEN